MHIIIMNSLLIIHICSFRGFISFFDYKYKMTEDAEDHEIFDINDFTTASDWERFIVRIEEIINEWKLSNSETYKTTNVN